MYQWRNLQSSTTHYRIERKKNLDVGYVPITSAIPNVCVPYIKDIDGYVPNFAHTKI